MSTSFQMSASSVFAACLMIFIGTYARAGIVVDSNGVLVSYTTEGVTGIADGIVINFEQASYIDANLTRDLANQFWFGDVTASSNLGAKLAEELSQYISANGGVDNTRDYLFAYQQDFGAFQADAKAVFVDRSAGGYQSYDYHLSETYNDGQVYWAYAVPEPGTAFAMSLLGMVGFVNHRRRRR